MAKCVNDGYDKLVPHLQKHQEVFTDGLINLVIELNQLLATPDNAQPVNLVVVTPKGKKRAAEKILATEANDGYDGDMRRLIDMLRATLIFKDHDQLAKAVCYFRKNQNKLLIVRENDGLSSSKDPSGYMDYKFTLSTGNNGLLGEVQMLACSLFYGKMVAPGRNGHKIYEDIRVLDKNTQKDQYNALIAESQKFYQPYTPPEGANIKCQDAVFENMETYVVAWDSSAAPSSAPKS